MFFEKIDFLLILSAELTGPWMFPVVLNNFWQVLISLQWALILDLLETLGGIVSKLETILMIEGEIDQVTRKWINANSGVVPFDYRGLKLTFTLVLIVLFISRLFWLMSNFRKDFLYEFSLFLNLKEFFDLGNRLNLLVKIVDRSRAEEKFRNTVLFEHGCLGIWKINKKNLLFRAFILEFILCHYWQFALIENLYLFDF